MCVRKGYGIGLKVLVLGFRVCRHMLNNMPEKMLLLLLDL